MVNREICRPLASRTSPRRIAEDACVCSAHDHRRGLVVPSRGLRARATRGPSEQGSSPTASVGKAALSTREGAAALGLWVGVGAQGCRGKSNADTVVPRRRAAGQSALRIEWARVGASADMTVDDDARGLRRGSRRTARNREFLGRRGRGVPSKPRQRARLQQASGSSATARAKHAANAQAAAAAHKAIVTSPDSVRGLARALGARDRRAPSTSIRARDPGLVDQRGRIESGQHPALKIAARARHEQQQTRPD